MKEVRLRNVLGLRKVHNIEYTTQESNSKKELDLPALWDSVLLPGEKLNIRTVFRRLQTPMSSCLECQTENDIEDSNKESEIQWYAKIFMFFVSYLFMALTVTY